MTALDQCRQDIDRVDRVIAALLRERARLALDAGRIKLSAGEPLASPEREDAVIAHARDLAAAPLAADQLARIFQAIVNETRAAEYQWLTDGAADVC